MTVMDAGTATTPVPMTISAFLSAPEGKRVPGGYSGAVLFAGVTIVGVGVCSVFLLFANCTFFDLFAVTVEWPGTVGTPNTEAGVGVPCYSNVVTVSGGLPMPEGSHAPPEVIGTDMGPDPVPGPSGGRKAKPFFTTGTSTHPDGVRFAAVGKVGGPGMTCDTNACTYVVVYGGIAGSTVAAVGTKVHAVSKVEFLVSRVAAFRRVGAGVITDPVPVPLVTRRIIPGMKRVPGEDAGMKFSLAVPFVGALGLFVIYSFLVFYFCGLTLNVLLFCDPPYHD